MKRFYAAAGIAQASGGWQLLLDGKPTKTPAGNPLTLPGEALAKAVAEEWGAQAEQITPPSMPLTQLACTAIDITAQKREEVIADLLGYGETDLVCYRDDRDRELANAQDDAYRPWLAWCKLRHQAGFELAYGILPVAQPEENPLRLRTVLEAYDDFMLTGFSQLVQVSGSLVLSLAAMEGELDAEQLFSLGTLEMRYQMERWGEDEEQREKLESQRKALAEAVGFLSLMADI